MIDKVFDRFAVNGVVEFCVLSLDSESGISKWGNFSYL